MNPIQRKGSQSDFPITTPEKTPKKDKKSGAVDLQRSKIGRSKEAPEIRKPPIKVIPPKDDSSTKATIAFQKKVDTFVQKLHGNKLKEQDISNFFTLLKKSRIPMTTKQLETIVAISKDRNSAFFDDPSLNQVIDLGRKFVKSLGELDTQRIDERQQDIQGHTGEMWECIDREPNETGGYTYIFKIKDSVDDITPNEFIAKRTQAAKDKVNEMFPAVEPKASDVLFLDPTQDRQVLIEQFIDMAIDVLVKTLVSLKSKLPFPLPLFNDDAILADLLRTGMQTAREELKPSQEEIVNTAFQLNELGYLLYYARNGEKGCYLELPDKQTLVARWEELRKEKPELELKSLDIQLSEGIADDMSFVEALLSHDVLLADYRSKEFVHDQISHVVSLLIWRLIASKSSSKQTGAKEEKIRVVRLIANEYKNLHIYREKLATNKLSVMPDDIVKTKAHLTQLETALGAYVDNASAVKKKETSELLKPLPRDIENEESSTSILYGILANPQWQDYFVRRYGKENFEPEALRDLIEAIQHEVT